MQQILHTRAREVTLLHLRPVCGSPLGPRELFLVKGLTLGVGVAWQEPRLQVEDPVYSAGGLRSEGPVNPPYTGMHLSFRTQNPLGLDVGGPMSPLPAPLERPREQVSGCLPTPDILR